jgi:dTDP-N-acetylfucosamine:lipid II N-acetylfucosaminyltransferase
MFLHLIHGDSKFAPLIRDLYEAVAPGRNVYVVYITDGRVFVEIEGIQTVRGPDLLRKLYGSRNDWDSVVVSGMCESLAPVLDIFPSSAKVAWFIWGYELYGVWPSLHNNLYGPATRRYVASNWKHLLRPHWWALSGRYRRMRKVLRRVNYFVSQFPEEFEILKEQGISFDMEYLDCPVIPLERVVDTESCFAALGADIQVGNSASYSNNHTEAFLRLAKMDLTGRKVIVPLSYGSAACRDQVIADGVRILGEHFEPVTEFMDLPKYTQLMQRCGIVIMNHNRQQAVGNVVAALWRGAHVMLNDTPVLKRFLVEGFSVHNIHTVESLIPLPLSKDEQLEQRTLLGAYLSREVVYSKARNVLNQLSASN